MVEKRPQQSRRSQEHARSDADCRSTELAEALVMGSERHGVKPRSRRVASGDPCQAAMSPQVCHHEQKRRCFDLFVQTGKKKFPMRGSNPRLKRERLQCYHYTNRLTYILLKFLPSIFSSPFLLRLSSLSFFHSSNKEKSKSFYVLIKKRKTTNTRHCC